MSQAGQQNRDIYWAAVPADELPAKVAEKVERYYQACQNTGRLDLWRKAYRTMFGMDADGRHVSAHPQRDGEQGELVTVKVGHARNLSNHLVNLTVQTRLSFDCRAKNTDSDASKQTILGQQWMDAKVRDKGIGRTLRRGVKIATDFCEAFFVTDWDKDAGEDHMVDAATGRVLKKGDHYFGAFYPDDVARELYEDENGEAPWHIVMREISVHELAAKYPDQADEILNLGGRRDHRYSILPDAYNSARELEDGDRVTVMTLYHRNVPHLKGGRRSVIAGDLVLEDSVLPFKKIYPVHRMAPENQGKTCFGYSSTCDLFSINDLIDMLYSAAATNFNSNAVNNFWSPPNNATSVTQLAGALNLIESPVKPEVLELCKMSPQAFEFIKMLETLMEIVSGVNSVARGNPEGALAGASGSALALLQSMTIQFASGLQEAYGEVAEAVGQAFMEIFQEKGTIPREEQLYGKENRAFTKPISGASFDQISKVQIDLGNPATRTFAGRKQIADEMLERQMFERPDQYLMFLATGRFEHLVEHKQTRLLLMRKENEDLKDGKPVFALWTDPHKDHILEHLSVLDDSEARRDVELTQRVLAHVQEHLDVSKTVPPDFAAMLGIAIPQLPGMMPPPDGGAGGPPPGAGGEGPIPAEMATGPQGEMPPGNMPRMPTNPLTQEQAPAAPAPAA